MNKKTSPNPSRLRRVFWCNGRMTTAWFVPLSLLLFFFAQWLGAWALGRISLGLFSVWGVTEKSIVYAHVWLQTAVGCYGSLEAAAQGLLSLLALSLAMRFLRKESLPFRLRHIFCGAGIGFALSGIAFAVLRLSGSVRTMPAAAVSPLGEALTLLGAFFAVLGPEALVGGVLFQTAFSAAEKTAAESTRMEIVLSLLFALLGSLFYLLSCAPTPGAITVCLCMSLACTALYLRRSYLSAAAMRCFWTFSAHRVFGFSASGDAGMFLETYPVSRDWLTGGDLGLESGWLCALLFALAALAIWKFLRNGGYKNV